MMDQMAILVVSMLNIAVAIVNLFTAIMNHQNRKKLSSEQPKKASNQMRD